MIHLKRIWCRLFGHDARYFGCEKYWISSNFSLEDKLEYKLIRKCERCGRVL